MDLRLAVLDAVPLHTPTQIDLGGALIGQVAQQRQVSAWEVFEEVSLEHARGLLPALTDLELCEPNTMSIDLHTPHTLTVVGQVKSGRTTGKAVLDQALGAAMLPGRGAGRQHVFVYSEAGYTQGSYEHADERGLFLWHVDYAGRVLPWSASARWLCTKTAELAGASVERTREILDEAAWRESADRISARDWFVELARGMWEDSNGPLDPGDTKWMTFLRWALQTAEGLQGAREFAHEALQGFDRAVQLMSQQDPGDPGWPPDGAVSAGGFLPWRDAYFEGDRNRHLWRLNWIANGAGEPTEDAQDWPDLDDEAMGILYAWNDNVWDGDSEYHVARREELRAVNKQRRAITRKALKRGAAMFQAQDPAAAAAMRTLHGGAYQCAECSSRGNLVDVTEFSGAPGLVTAERVWAAILRREPAPPHMFRGFSRSQDYAHLFWQ